MRRAGWWMPSVLGVLAMVTGGIDASGGPERVEEPSIEDLDWLAGHWSGDLNGTFQEEYWMAPRGGMLLGLHRDSPQGKPAFFEYLRIEARQDGIYYVASPRGGASTSFKLVELHGEQALFENPQHDYPQRVRYRREGDTLIARIEGDSGGRARSSEWQWELSQR